MTRLFCAAFAGLFIAALAGAVEAEAPVGTFVYAIRHQDHGDIGTLTIVSTRQGDERVYDQQLHIAVKLLFVTAYHQDSERKEAWRGDRLIAYDAKTDDDGKKSTIVGRAQGDKFVIDGPAGHFSAPATVYPSNPFDPGIVTATLVMDTGSGKLLHVTVTPGAEETITAGGGTMKARRYAMTGDLQRDLWFDDSGKLLKFSFKNDGALVTFTLK
ncbi:MAG TPA: DUF6134 family protein [Alphaproteobacteria bacterium]|nr:DUF6134 family protein [Alphaproteobacteria bacterium]